jgi:hypothetical protein
MPVLPGGKGKAALSSGAALSIFRRSMLYRIEGMASKDCVRLGMVSRNHRGKIGHRFGRKDQALPPQ